MKQSLSLGTIEVDLNPPEQVTRHSIDCEMRSGANGKWYWSWHGGHWLYGPFGTRDEALADIEEVTL